MIEDLEFQIKQEKKKGLELEKYFEEIDKQQEEVQGQEKETTELEKIIRKYWGK